MGCARQHCTCDLIEATGTHTVMAPLMEKSSTFEKCHKDTSDSKQSRFSFHWLLRRSKSSKTTKEMTQDENSLPNIVPTSKSCDSGITNLSAVDKYSTFLLWRLLPTRGKSPTHCDNTNLVEDSNVSSTKFFKTSFSCGDVYGLLSKSQKPVTAKSSQNIPNMAELSESHPFNPSHSSRSLNRLRKSCHCLNATAQSCSQLISKDITPNVFHLVLCKLCLTMVPASKMYSLEDCGCVFCNVCMQQYLLFNIKEGNVEITCPDADCVAEGKVLMTEVHKLVGDEAFYLFQRFKLDREIEQDPNRTWCPAAGCETICSVHPSTNPKKGTAVHCHNCSLTFCSACKGQWHSYRTCDEFRRFISGEEEFYVSDDEDSSIKRCPNCHIPIERDEGCAQMMCKRCKHVFCWHCLASLDDDFLLRHYDKGPCRNKLGHSRASMVWHRTQVVGIFAGFSFLLLMASPILLLAAPCLLCCRCKNCKFFYEEPTPL